MTLQTSRPDDVASPPERTTDDGLVNASSALADAVLLSGYQAAVVGRRFDRQATSLAKQGYLTVYPSSQGQEACQVAAAMVLQPSDWMFPTYRDSVAILTRGVPPGRVLTQMHGSWHCGYDPAAVRTAPQCTPLATHAAHAVGLALAARRRRQNIVAMAMCGDGATSEGAFHEALNLAAVFEAPVVFFIQNNGYAISTPVSRQTRAATLAAKAAGYGIPGVRVDGNDFEAVLTTLQTAVDAARRGAGPTLVEAETFRLGPHTNADDPRRYRDPAEVAVWQSRDPVGRLHAAVRRRGLLDAEVEARIAESARQCAEATRQGVLALKAPDADELFTHVYHCSPPNLSRQRRETLDRLGGSA